MTKDPASGRKSLLENGEATWDGWRKLSSTDCSGRILGVGMSLDLPCLLAQLGWLRTTCPTLGSALEPRCTLLLMAPIFPGLILVARRSFKPLSHTDALTSRMNPIKVRFAERNFYTFDLHHLIASIKVDARPCESSWDGPILRRHSPAIIVNRGRFRKVRSFRSCNRS